MIYLIRHGQTEANVQDRFQGRIDSPLTPLGEGQARAMGVRLRDLVAADGGEWILRTSPLGRARRTAQIIAEAAGLPDAVADQRLVEVSYGEMEGLTRAEADARWPTLAGVTGIFGRAPGGESFAALAARLGDWLAEAGRSPGGRRLVAVSHAGAVRTLRGLYRGLDESAIRQLDKPQGVIFRLAGGSETRIDCQGARA